MPTGLLQCTRTKGHWVDTGNLLANACLPSEMIRDMKLELSENLLSSLSCLIPYMILPPNFLFTVHCSIVHCSQSE